MNMKIFITDELLTYCQYQYYILNYNITIFKLNTGIKNYHLMQKYFF
jgi:hypothetical protein